MSAATIAGTGVRRSRKKKHKTPRTRRPEGMSLEQWQIALRREFAQEQKFRLVNVGQQEFFSDYNVSNPQTGRTYRVAIRGGSPGDNHCSCPDFMVNTLGTCKHIEFVLWRLARRSGGRRALAGGYRPAFSEVYLRYGARREVALRRGTELPPENLVHVRDFLDEQDVFDQGALERFERVVEELRKNGHEVRCHDDALQFVAQCRDQRALFARVGQLFPRAEEGEGFEGLLKVKMYPYQQRGALFAARAGRSLLADDMGLGKTIQALAAAEILARAAGVERVLVVSPTSLKHQWKQEIEKFTARPAMVIEGGTASRRAIYGHDSFYKIVNYELLHRDLEMIRGWAPDLIILDEAQRIKNWKTRAARTVKQLESQHAIVLTGTPLENRLEELHSIVEFVDRFRLGPAFRFLAEHQQLDKDGRVVGYHNLAEISKTLEPILLRRTKGEVLKELPQRLDKHLFVPMTPQQQAHHDDNQEIVARIVAKWRRYGFLTETDQKRMTCALQNMRMVCNSTYLLDPATNFGHKVDELMAQLSEVLEDAQTKVVIFSQWVRSHELLQERLERQRRKFVLFHGCVPGPKRKDLIARFKQEANCRVFLSTDAGGVGLNLQNASAVFNMDQPWNPAVLEQRVGRVHRLGQQRPVHVIHFVAKGTIEHGMLDLLKFKASLFAGVLDGGQDEVFMGGTRLKRFMESVEAASGAATEARANGGVNGISAQPPEPARPEVPAIDRPAAATVASVAAGASHQQLMTQLIGVGRTFLDRLSQALAPTAMGSNERISARGAGGWRVERDAGTGEQFLKIPVPPEEVLGRAAVWLQALAGALGGVK